MVIIQLLVQVRYCRVQRLAVVQTFLLSQTMIPIIIRQEGEVINYIPIIRMRLVAVKVRMVLDRERLYATNVLKCYPANQDVFLAKDHVNQWCCLCLNSVYNSFISTEVAWRLELQLTITIIMAAAVLQVLLLL